VAAAQLGVGGDGQPALLPGCLLPVGPDGGQAGFAGAEADLAEFVAGPLRCPGGFDGIGVAQVQQDSVWQAADVRAADGAEGGEGLVPERPLAGVARYRLGSDRLSEVFSATFS
jgi:hypothetical protein